MLDGGKELTRRGALNLDFSRVEVVAVSGAGPNVFGRCILFVSGPDGVPAPALHV